MSEIEKRETSDPDWSNAYREDKTVPWYRSNIDQKVTPEVHTQTLSLRFPPSEVILHPSDPKAARAIQQGPISPGPPTCSHNSMSPHCRPHHLHKNIAHISQRDKAWAVRSYPCTGLGLWLDPMLPKSPAYASIIQKLQAGASFLDIGCFIGQDLRRLVADGAPSDRLYAVDVVSHWDVGYKKKVS